MSTYRRSLAGCSKPLQSSLIFRRFRITAGEAARFPLRPMGTVCHFNHELPDDVFILAGSREVDRLLKIGRWGIITVGQPVLVDLLLLRSGWGNIHRQRGNAVTNEAVLVAAHKDVS